MSEKLLPCPFCGGKAKLHIEKFINYIQGYFVYCKQCNIATPMDDDKQIVIELWNRRANENA